ncbi:MAG: cytochrome c3 family protein [bacterium]
MMVLRTRILIAFLILAISSPLTPRLIFAQEQSLSAENNQCLVCHLDVEYLPDDYLEDNIHLKTGLTCASCHGGDSTSDDEEVAKAPEAGFVGVPSKEAIPQFCGKCHSDIVFMRQYQPRIVTDQVDQFYTSVHGIRLREGDEKVADCTSCHTAHGILSARDTRSSVHALNVPQTCNKCHGDSEYMGEYGIRTDQLEDFAQSVHGIALLENQDTGSPACNDCHGNHGAMPPGVTSISHVCGTCHSNNMQYFSTSKMAREFEELELHACEECHGNHAVKKTFDDMVGVGESSVCMDCHDTGDEGYKSAEGIHDALREMVAAYDTAEVRRKEVQRIGMEDEEIGFLLQEANQSLIQARTLVHTFDPEKVGEKTQEGREKAETALELASQQIKEYDVRRLGFGVATFFITILVVALYLKIRDMEKK